MKLSHMRACEISRAWCDWAHSKLFRREVLPPQINANIKVKLEITRMILL